MFKRQDQIKLQDKLQESISQRLKVEASRTRRIIHFWICDKSNGRLIMRKFVFSTRCVLMTAIQFSTALAAEIQIAVMRTQPVEKTNFRMINLPLLLSHNQK